ALYSKELLRRKIDTYRRHSVTAFPGGQFLEYAISRNLTDAYLKDTVDSGFEALEVSDNLLELAQRDKHEIISHAHNDFGLKVLGEVGSKADVSSAKGLIDDALGCLEAGAWKVLFEAAEFYEDGHFRDDLAEQILSSVPVDQVIFELPGSWIAGISASDVHDMQVWLLERVGPQVNVGNVAPGDVVSFEALRLNLGVKMRFDTP
ncbi:MAG: phosphosulfolactate synthase, partial [Trueperaceae bacterium]